MQVIYVAQLKFLNFVTKWQGGTHYSFILQNKTVGLQLQQGGIGDYWLIIFQIYVLD